MTRPQDGRSDLPRSESPSTQWHGPPLPLDPPAGLAGLQAEVPLARVRLWDGSTPWLVTRHSEQRALLADSRVSAHITRLSARHHPGRAGTRGQGAPSSTWMTRNMAGCAAW
jgi:hypothetical protein